MRFYIDGTPDNPGIVTVVNNALSLVLAGIGLGLVGGFGVSRFVGSLVEGVARSTSSSSLRPFCC